MCDTILESARDVFIGKYFVWKKDDKKECRGEIVKVRRSGKDYDIVVKDEKDSILTHFFYTKKDVEFLIGHKHFFDDSNRNTYVFDSEADSEKFFEKQSENASGEVVSAETEHTTDIDVWKQRWWDVFRQNHEHYIEVMSDERNIASTNETIQNAMRGMNDFFKDK